MWAYCEEGSVAISGSCILHPEYDTTHGGVPVIQNFGAAVSDGKSGWHCAWNENLVGDHRSDAAVLCARLDGKGGLSQKNQ
jgi:hypothetical protein